MLEEVKRHFTDGEIVEMSLMSGKQGMMNRFMDSFGIPIEDEGEVNKIRKSVRGQSGQDEGLSAVAHRQLARGVPRTQPGRVGMLR